MKRFIDDYYYPKDDDLEPLQPEPTKSAKTAAAMRFLIVSTLKSLALCAAAFPICWITFHYHTPVNPWLYPAAAIGLFYLLFLWFRI